MSIFLNDITFLKKIKIENVNWSFIVAKKFFVNFRQQIFRFLGSL